MIQANPSFQIDHVVRIQMDSLDPDDQALLTPLLKSRESFIAHAQQPGVSEKLPVSAPLYAMKAHGDWRFVYREQDGNILVQDLMHKKTVDWFCRKVWSDPSLNSAP